MHATVTTKTPVPAEIRTPSTVETGIVTLEFTDGYPKGEPDRVAARKGRSFFGYFLISLIFFPAALIVAYMLSDRRAVMA